MKILLSLTVFAISTGLSQAALIQFNLLGKGGAGLLSTNENGAIAGTPGSGGEIGAGIIYDDVTKMLTINVGWGTGNGFTNLSGDRHVGPHPRPDSVAAPGFVHGKHGRADWARCGTHGVESSGHQRLDHRQRPDPTGQ